MPVWQSLYEELKDQNFEIISAAQDSGGAEAADSFFANANVTYTAIIDEKHRISSLYNFVNVPSAAWIDEEGKIVRINEGTYAREHVFGTNFKFGTDDYAPAVRDWVAKGADSQFVWDAQRVSEKIKQRTPEAERAEPAFKLSTFFLASNNQDKADEYSRMAQELSPDNINYFRQDLSFTAEGSSGATFAAKTAALAAEGKDYYAPLELEATPK